MAMAARTLPDIARWILRTPLCWQAKRSGKPLHIQMREVLGSLFAKRVIKTRQGPIRRAMERHMGANRGGKHRSGDNVRQRLVAEHHILGRHRPYKHRRLDCMGPHLARRGAAAQRRDVGSYQAAAAHASARTAWAQALGPGVGARCCDQCFVNHGQPIIRPHWAPGLIPGTLLRPADVLKGAAGGGLSALDVGIASPDAAGAGNDPTEAMRLRK